MWCFHWLFECSFCVHHKLLQATGMCFSPHLGTLHVNANCLTHTLLAQSQIWVHVSAVRLSPSASTIAKTNSIAADKSKSVAWRWSDEAFVTLNMLSSIQMWSRNCASRRPVSDFASIALWPFDWLLTSSRVARIAGRLFSFIAQSELYWHAHLVSL